MLEVIVASAFDEEKRAMLEKDGYKVFSSPNTTLVHWCKDDLKVTWVNDWYEQRKHTDPVFECMAGLKDRILQLEAYYGSQIRQLSNRLNTLENQ